MNSGFIIKKERARFMKIRYLEEDFRDKHDGEEIWVIGCGPSLDDVPDGFFKDKISIALNWAFVAFPECTYLHWYHSIFTDFVRNGNPELFKRCILLLPAERMDTPDGLGEYKIYPIWMKWRGWGCTQKRIEEQAKAVIEKQHAGYEGDCIGHTAIWASFIMGAKRVILVGCEQTWRQIKSNIHAQKRGLSDHYKIRSEYQINERYETGLKWIVGAFKKYGKEVTRYYHGKGYEEIM